MQIPKGRWFRKLKSTTLLKSPQFQLKPKITVIKMLSSTLLNCRGMVRYTLIEQSTTFINRVTNKSYLFTKACCDHLKYTLVASKMQMGASPQTATNNHYLSILSFNFIHCEKFITNPLILCPTPPPFLRQNTSITGKNCIFHLVLFTVTLQ